MFNLFPCFYCPRVYVFVPLTVLHHLVFLFFSITCFSPSTPTLYTVLYYLTLHPFCFFLCPRVDIFFPQILLHLSIFFLSASPLSHLPHLPFTRSYIIKLFILFYVFMSPKVDKFVFCMILFSFFSITSFSLPTSSLYTVLYFSTLQIFASL